MNSKLTPPVFHFGAWDGSAGIPCGPAHFVGASDEDNSLRLYPTTGGAQGKVLLDLNTWPPFPKKAHADGVTFREADIESASAIGDTIYWISSHARDREGKRREERQVLFATTLRGDGAQARLACTGNPYTRLLDDIAADPRQGFLHAALQAGKAPKAEGGFNIEALCADGELLYIGFRNPIPHGRALIQPLMNPQAVIQTGAAALLGDPILLDLGGLGFRDMVKWRGGFLIVAGDYRDRFEDKAAQPPKLFQWSGKTNAAPCELAVDLLDLNPEAALVFGDEAQGRLMILSDDGKWDLMPGEVRQMTAAPQRRFRSAWLEDSEEVTC